MDDVLEDDRVDILPHQVDEEPVSHVALADDHVDALPLDASVAESQDEGPDVWREDDGYPVDENQEGEHPEDEQPEPDEDVDLLVDNVERQDAQGVVLLNVARRAKLVEGALCHAREDVNHGVNPVLLITVCE